LIVVQIFWNQFCTHLSQFKSRVTICWTVHSLILSSSAIIRNVKRLFLAKESPRKVDVCVSSLRGEASRLQCIFQAFSPIYKVFVSPKYLSTW
jgi:hypothetical protein